MNALLKSAPAAAVYKLIPLASIVDSPTQPRKSYDKEHIAKLAASIARQGMLHAPIVVPARVAGVVVPNKYVMVTGHCRRRAAEELTWKEIEVKIVDAGDVEVAEQQLVENDARLDLSPLDRAEGYQLLHRKFGLTVDQIAERVSNAKDPKSRASIYAAMKLCELIDAGKKALRDGVDGQAWNASCAELVARLPVSMQAEVLKKALEINYADNLMSFRDLKEMIRNEYMLDLKKAPFDTKDATLVPAAGACITCPKRTGAQSDMFGGKKISADICTDRDSWNKKVAAHKAAVVAKAKEAGKPVLNAAESKAALNGGYSSSWVKLDDKHYDGKGQKSWADELKGTKLEPQIAIDSSGKQIKVAKKEDVRAALEEKGAKAAKAHAIAPPYRYESAKSEPDPKRALQEKVVPLAIMCIVEKISAKGLTRELMLMLAKQLWEVSEGYVIERRGLEAHVGDEKHIERYIEGLAGDRLAALVFEFAFESHFHQLYAGYSTDLVAVSKCLGIDLKGIEKEVTDNAKLKAAIESQEALKPSEKEQGKDAADAQLVKGITAKSAPKKLLKKPAKKPTAKKAKKAVKK